MKKRQGRRPSSRKAGKPSQSLRRKSKKPFLRLRISKGLDKLFELEASQPKATSESIFSLNEQSILKRIQDIHLGKREGKLTEVDYRNLRRIASKHNIKFP